MTVSLFRDASEGAEMPIVCSCNVFSDHQVRSVVAKEARRPRMNEVYAGLGCSAHRMLASSTINCAAQQSGRFQVKADVE
jgi:hypothetical protein